MSIWKYKYLTPATLANKLALIKAKDLIDLTNKNLEYVHSMLMKTPYGADISSIQAQKIDSSSLDKALLKTFISTCQKIARYSPKDIRLLINAYTKKFEIRNVKALLRSRLAGLDTEEAMRLMVPIGKEYTKYQEILTNSTSIRGLVEQLLDSQYGFVLAEKLVESEKSGNMLLLEICLDEYFYKELWRAVRKLRGLDREIAETVVGLEIASANTRIILKCKMMGLGKDVIRQHLILIPEVSNEKDFEEALNAADIEDCLEKLFKAGEIAATRDYQHMLSDIQREYGAAHSLSSLELTLDRSLLKANLRMLKRYTSFFNIGLILAFINLKWFEVRNLRAIVKGLEEGIPANEIKGILVLAD